jgi:hypothetical protein
VFCARRWLAAFGALAVLAACSAQRVDGVNVTGDEVDTHQIVAAGQMVRITARGTVDFGGGVAGIGATRVSADGDDGPATADSPAPHLRRNSLVVRIGDAYYQGGVDKTFITATAGDVVVRANSAKPPSNATGWDVQVDLGDRATTGGAPDDSGSSPPAAFEQVPVNGDLVWTDLYVAAGSTVHLTSSGVVDFGRAVADGMSPRVNADGTDDSAPMSFPATNLRPHSLIAQVGESSAWYQGGSDATFVPATSGVLVLAANDDDIHDNTQTWFVSGRVTAPASGTAFGPFVVSNTAVETGLTVTAGQKIHVEGRGRLNLGGAATGEGQGDVIDDVTGDGSDSPTPGDYPAPALLRNSLVVRIGSLYYQGGTSVDITARAAGAVVVLPNDVLPEDNKSVFNDGVRGWSVTLTRR